VVICLIVILVMTVEKKFPDGPVRPMAHLLEFTTIIALQK